ncbi:Heat shock factor-binding protein 1 [Gryllus bimaculatus]|nr:Heat shock factor-binding protein 1 [Gryllus bimaculatus]
MADMKQDLKTVEDQQNYTPSNNSDPKNMQELTQYVQTLLQGMQDNFQTIVSSGIYWISDKIRVKYDFFFVGIRNLVGLFKLDRNEMGNRIDDLEKNIADLMTQAGVEGPEK